MKKLQLADITPPAAYGALRDARRRHIIELKKKRRVSVGPQITLVFENRDTMRHQVEEMCFVEGIREPEKIQHEVDTYNRVLPDDGEVAATLFIEVTSDLALRRTLDQLIGLHEHVWLTIDGTRARALFDPDQFAVDKLAAVQYLRVPLDAAQRKSMARAGADVRLLIDHPQYQHEARISETTRAELAADLA
jgi:hypothetical protein